MGISGDELTRIVVQRLRENASRFDLKHVADFCDVEPTAVAKWLGGGKPLGGLYTIKLWFFLDQAGVSSPELDEIRRRYPEGEYLGRLLAFKVLTMEEVCALAPQEKRVGEGTIFRMVRNEGRPTKWKPDLDELQVAYGERLDETVEGFMKKLGRGSSVQEPNALRSGSQEVTPPTSSLSQDSPVAMPRIELIRGIAETLQLANVAAHAATTVLSPEERELLRKLMGPKGMFDFSNAVDTLTTEFAFNARSEEA